MTTPAPPNPRRLGAWLLCAIVAATTACSYRAGLVARGADGVPAESLGIRVFDNQSRRPDLERDLHAEMSTAAHRFVDSRLVRPDAAELVIVGSIEELQRTGGVRTGDNELLEFRETVRIDAALRDERRGVEVRRASTTVRVGGLLDVPDAEVDARRRAVSVAAERLVLLLLSRPDEPAAGADASVE